MIGKSGGSLLAQGLKITKLGYTFKLAMSMENRARSRSARIDPVAQHFLNENLSVVFSTKKFRQAFFSRYFYVFLELLGSWVICTHFLTGFKLCTFK
jgi:hypothetical protein